MAQQLWFEEWRSRGRRRVNLVQTLVVVCLAAWGQVQAAGAGQVNGDPAVSAASAPNASLLRTAPYGNWETFTTRDGLPSDKVFAVKIDGPRVWVGTTKGLALYVNGTWRRFGVEDGLPYPVILSLDVCLQTGDLWIGTMGGLARLSGGRIDTFTQLNSGLSNDFVNSVRCDPDLDDIWAATAMGANRYQLKTREWTTYTHTNTPMREPWTYSLAFGKDSVYVGAWGGGIVEYTKTTGRWREYLDPDKEFEVDLFANDGPVHDVTSAVAFADGVLWQSTYFGATRYDGRTWTSYFAADSGLASDFVNGVHAQGRIGWFATDRGLSATDGRAWITYRRTDAGRGAVEVKQGKRVLQESTTATAIAHNLVYDVDTRGDDVWIATAAGVTHGTRLSEPVVTASVAAAAASEEEDADTGLTQARVAYASTPIALEPFQESLPYRDFFVERIGYYGPGRDQPDPVGLKDVAVGFMGPLEDVGNPQKKPEVSPERTDGLKAMLGRRMFLGATLAAEEANTAGGYRGLPFRILPRTDLVLWGQSSNQLVKFVYEDQVWSILSGIDSNHNHVVSRAAIRTEIPVLNAGSTDPTLVEHNVQWLVRDINDDRQNAYVLANEIFNVRKLSRVALLRVNERDGRMGIKEFDQAARRLGHPVVIEQRFDLQATDFQDQLVRIRDVSPDALVLWGNPIEAGLIVRQARQLGIEVPIFGFDRMADSLFLQTAGATAEGVVIAATMNPDSDDPVWRGFLARYRQRWGEAPDAFAAHAYDGMNLLIDAIRKSGLNRVRIRDTLYAMKDYHGVTGTIIFDTNMNDVSTPWLAVVKGGRYQYYPAPKW